MRKAFGRRSFAGTALVAAMGLVVVGDAPSSRADDSAAAQPTPIVSANPAARTLGRRSGSDAVPLRAVKQRQQAQSRPSAPNAADAPPVPMEPDAAAASQPRLQPVPRPAPVVVAPAVPFAAPFIGPGRSAFHERLRARRMARVQQMRRDAEASGDQQGVQRAEMLEGAVNQLHEQGLFNFAQKVAGAFQSGQLSLDQLKGGGQASSSGSSVELPDADLGEAAPLTSDPLPETDLGAPAQLPTEDAPAAAPSEIDATPTLPPPPPAN